MKKTLPCITVKQPFADMIATGEKDIENRSWPTNYRGPILIHAGLSWHESQEHRKYETQRGGIIGAAIVSDCVTSHKSKHFSGPFGFVLTFPVRLPFVACRGQLSIYKVTIEDEECARKINEWLERAWRK